MDIEIGTIRKCFEFDNTYKIMTDSQEIKSTLEYFLLEDKEDVTAIMYSSFDDYIIEVWISFWAAPYYLYATYEFIGYLNP